MSHAPARTVLRSNQEDSFEYTAEEHEVVSKALGKVAAELEGLGAEALEPRKALLYLAERILASDPPALGDRAERKESPFTILYHVCPSCRRGGVMTESGLVEVPGESLERVEAEAEKLELPGGDEDPGAPAAEEAPQEARPVPRALARRVRLRSGGRCANPHCGARLGLQVHHVRFRSLGGRTEAGNLTSVCRRCHSAIHAGLLEVSGDPVLGLRFQPRVRGPLEELGDLAGRVAELEEAARAPRAPREPGLDLRGLEGGLVSLGFSPREAGESLRGAIERLRASGEALGEEAVLKEALRRPSPQLWTRG